MRRLGDGEAFPDLPAGCDIQRNHTAAESAALVAGRGAGDLLDRGNRHIYDAGIQGWRPGDPGGRMILHLGLPEQCTCGRIHRVGVGAHIPKKTANWSVSGMAPKLTAVRTNASVLNTQRVHPLLASSA